MATSVLKQGSVRLFSTVMLTIFIGGCGESVVTESNDSPDPVVVDIPVAFVKRTLPTDDNGNPVSIDLRDPAQFVPGAGLYIKARASVSATEVNLTDRLFVADGVDVTALSLEERPQYDIKDLHASYDGTRLLFALRAPEIENADEDEQPTWNIWEYDRTDDSLRRIITSDIVAEAGQDTAPVYLPDGRIVFSSTRQRTNQAILLDEGKPQYSGLEERLQTPASVLHVMDATGDNITQISFNQSHDLDPVVLPGGKILFSRWDQAGGNKGMHLYQVNPDGSDLEIVYGRHSHTFNGQTQQFTKARLTPDGEILASVRDFESSRLGDNFAVLDTTQFIDTNMPVASADSLTGPAQTNALFDTVDTQADISPGGYFADVYPLWDGSGRQLFTWSQCRVMDPDDETGEVILPCDETLLANPDIEAGPELYGMWIYDPQTQTQQVIGVPVEGIAYTEVVSMETRDYPDDYTGPEDYDAELAAQNKGAIHILSVYDFGGEDFSPAGLADTANPAITSPDERSVRFIRISKSVSIPDDDVQDVPNSAFGPNRNQLMREIIGYSEVQPDGSVMLELPANVPLSLSLLDADGKRISARHNNWLQVAPGEIRTCHGCHTTNSEVPHGREDAEYAAVNQGAVSTGVAFPGANPALFADAGDTMAQTRSRVLGSDYPQADIHFEDVWSDPATTTVAADFTYAYADLQTALPVTQNCAQTWTVLCRIVINFETHIQPLFDLPRQTLDSEGNVLTDHTCVSCHAPTDSDGLTKVPDAQLNLTSQASTDNPDQMTSYRELLFSDNAQEIDSGILVDIMEIVRDANGNVVYERDENGDLILDAEGNPIPVMAPVPVSAAASANGAAASSTLFTTLETGTHAGWMSAAERRLLAEWLDIGAQYYNNPFDVPQD